MFESIKRGIGILAEGAETDWYSDGWDAALAEATLRVALEDRGVNFDRNSRLDPDGVFGRDMRLRGDYNPTSAALETIRARIAEKIAMKPQWYRYHGAPNA